jgi:PAS domain-containing protein
MEIMKFRLQLFIAFEQAEVRVHRAQNVLARWKRIVANKARGLGYALRAKTKVRLHQTRIALARQKRIVANKARGLGYMLRAKTKVRLHQAQNVLARWKRSFANKARGLSYALRAKTRVRLHRAQNVLARRRRSFANKARGLGYALRAKTKVRLHRAQNVLARRSRSFANKARGLSYALRAKTKIRLHQAQNELARSKRIVANEAQGLSYALRAKTKVCLHRAQNTLSSMERTFADKARELGDVLHAEAIASGEWLRGVLDAIVVMQDKTRKSASRFLVGSEQLAAPLRRIKNRFAGVKRSIAERPGKLEETLHSSDDVLPRLLESASDAMVVMNKELRFIGANAKALDVFGISEKNMKMFSMDAFLRSQILPYDENCGPSTSQKEWHGECKIQRLDGSLRVVDFIFVPNYVPLLHVCVFRNDRKWQSEKRFAA